MLFQVYPQITTVKIGSLTEGYVIVLFQVYPQITTVKIGSLTEGYVIMCSDYHRKDLKSN